MVLGITMGDASGVGPEIVLRAFVEKKLPPESVVIGDRSVLQYCCGTLGFSVPLHTVRAFEPEDPAALNVHDTGMLSAADVRPGELSCEAGHAALEYLRAAIGAALRGDIGAIVTLPMNKAATRLSTPSFTGHTDVIAEACGTRDYTMTLISDKLIAAHVSSHVSLREAIEGLNAERIATVIRLTANVAQKLQRTGPVGVLGLNPHAGEDGAFGGEEEACIGPAIEQAREQGDEVAGPLPPDTAFARALRGGFAALVCMYHDQGHIALKTLGFDDAVNVTVGLPIIRTSVDHGTAFDIAYKGVASAGSFVNACRLALRLAGPD
jgi:4-hydroxythreonine-4-phosphate dehydrogenase